MSDLSASGTLAGLSIILPVLEEARAIQSTLALLQPWRAQGAEIVVVDGGSEDGTAGLAAPTADRVLVSPPGRGLQMNAGARAATGRLLLFLHADTRLPPVAMRELARMLADDAPGWGRFDIQLDGHHCLLPVVARLMNLRSALTGIATGDQALFVTRDWFLRVGGFEEIPLMEDIRFSRALRALAWPRRLRCRATTSGRRWERHGAVRTILLMWTLRLLHFLGVEPTRLARWYQAVR